MKIASRCEPDQKTKTYETKKFAVDMLRNIGPVLIRVVTEAVKPNCNMAERNYRKQPTIRFR